MQQNLQNPNLSIYFSEWEYYLEKHIIQRLRVLTNCSPKEKVSKQIYIFHIHDNWHQLTFGIIL